ncbi:hypothetical protein [Pseudomonas agarici]|uniref:hypothetical protein n=1 Tax=Pseudomonas agarici TaxID=46677 RepID=UPI0008C25570|nr:hypothetical protein [Pseudomonas agarici]NWB92627.1 hypothetical protein [Pseudomonas agarici]NWC07545.1 hypothetical protein [Pseudomonas agarici]SEL07580.1 hypothetical protein SAMN05216604_110133 [Pseudomonas agarici]
MLPVSKMQAGIHRLEATSTPASGQAQKEQTTTISTPDNGQSTSQAHSSLALPKHISFNGKNFKVGALKGSIDSNKMRQLLDATDLGAASAIKQNADLGLTYETSLKSPQGKYESVSVSLSADKNDNLNKITLKNHNNDQSSFHVEFDHTSAIRGFSHNAHQYSSTPLVIPAGALSDGGLAPRHPGGERYQVMQYMKSGEEPLMVIGLKGSESNNFVVYNSKNHKPVGQLKIIDGPASGQVPRKVLVDLSEAKLRGGMRHIKRRADGVKTSRSSPTGYKLHNGQPCDRHGNPVPGSSSSIVAQVATNNSASISLQHIGLPLSQRPYSAYATQVRQALHGKGEAKLDAHAATYYSATSQPVSAITAIDGVIASLDRYNPDEVRLSEFLQHLQSQAAAGHPVSLPDYYHCTKEQGFDEMLSSSNPRVNVQTPRTGTGAQGAWLSTKPDVSAFGPFVFGFNHHLDLLHSTTHPAQGKSTIANAGGEYHIGIQEPISLTGRNAYSNAENPLSIVGAPANAIEEYKRMVANLGPQLSFPRADGSTDVAVFNTETIQKLAFLLREQEPLKYPKSW